MNPADAALQAEVLALTRKFGERVYGIAYRWARTEEDTEDLVQEIWTRAIEVLAQGAPDSPREGWITLLALNVARDWARDRYRWSDFKERALRYFAIERENQRADGEPPEPRGRAEDRVWRAVEALPALQRDVVLLRVVEGMSTVQAANAINRSEGTVKSSLHRALETLRKRLPDLESLWVRGDL